MVVYVNETFLSFQRQFEKATCDNILYGSGTGIVTFLLLAHTGHHSSSTTTLSINNK
jgi:hypothetical protein